MSSSRFDETTSATATPSKSVSPKGKTSRSKSPQGKNQKRRGGRNGGSNTKMEFLISELEFTYNHTRRTANKRIKKLKKEIKKKDRIIESMKAERELTAKASFMSFNPPPPAAAAAAAPPPMMIPSEMDPPSPNSSVPMSARYRYNQIPPLVMSQPPPAGPGLMKGHQNSFVIPQPAASMSSVQNSIGTSRTGIKSPGMLSPVGSWCGSSKSSEDGSTVNEAYNSNMVVINMLNNDKQQLMNDKQVLINQLFERNREYDLLKEKYEVLKKKYEELKSKTKN